MARTSDTATFSSEAHKHTVDEMRARRESIHAKGEKVYRETGHMDPLVDVKGKVRRSKFAWKRNDDGTFTLLRGYKRPYMFSTDGTGSFGRFVGEAFLAAPRIYAMLEGNTRENHHMDFSFSVFQDRVDSHDVIQVPEFESDERFSDHMRLLVPDSGGGDTPEDYDLGIWYAANRVEADIFRYGGKGIFTMLLDAPGRGRIERELVNERLGVKLQSDVATKAVWQQLLAKFHGFVVVYNDCGALDFWPSIVGQGRLVEAPSSELFAEVQAGLVYVTDNAKPTEEGLYAFLRAGGQNSGISKNDASRIWRAYIDAKVPFGLGVKQAVELPKPGDVFARMTDKWPIGHPRASENVIPIGKESDDASDDEPTGTSRRSPIDWSKF